MVCGLELGSARKHVMGRSAGPVEPNCHRLNIATVRIKRYLKCYLKRERFKPERLKYLKYIMKLTRAELISN